MTEPDGSRDRDRAAIEAAVDDWLEGWRRVDADLATSHYADDADWTNAFGVIARGRAAIRATLDEILRQPHVMAGSDTLVGNEIWFVRSDVAIAWTRIDRMGQRTPSGQPLGIRRTTHLRVFVTNGLGWQIVSHLISDARRESLPDH